VLVTRPDGQADRLTQALLAEGAQAVAIPVIRIEPPASWDTVDAAIRRSGYDWVVFTSANGVRFFAERLRAAGHDTRWFDGTRTAAIGPETARTLRKEGVEADLVPDEYVAEALVACLADAGPLAGRRVLLPRADIARDALRAGLAAQGAEVESVVAYRTLPAAAPADLVDRLRSGSIDVVTFTSSSTVRALLATLGRDSDALQETTIACIGPVTAKTAQEAGLRTHVVASTYTVAGLVGALREYFGMENVPPP
jgi:uroporphyrinogen III methyltransferase/synthase